jgi:MFS family permease
VTDFSRLPLRVPFFYGWVIVATAFVTMAIAVNSRTAFSLLYPAILDEFGWGRGVTAAAFSIGFIGSAAFTPVVGLLMDRYGPRLVLPFGAVLVALGYVGATRIDTPVGLYVTLGLLVVCGSVAMSYLSHSMFLPNWFVRRRGLAIGIAFAGVGVGSMLLLPLLQQLIDGRGWRAACLATAVLVLLVLVPLNAWLPRRDPAACGLRPDGDGDGETEAAAVARAVVDKDWAGTSWTLRRAMATGRFWWLLGGYFCALFAWYSVQVHQTRYLLDIGFDATVAASALGLVGLCGVAGQIGIGALSDRVGREPAWTLCLAGYAACYGLLLALEQRPSLPLLYGMVVCQGLLGYGLAALYGAIPAELFAGPKFATIFSVISLGGNLGAGIGPWVTGVVFDRSGSYAPAFWLCLALALVSIACIWLAAPRKVRLVAGRASRRVA